MQHKDICYKIIHYIIANFNFNQNDFPFTNSDLQLEIENWKSSILFWDNNIIEMIINSGLPAMICGIQKPILNAYRVVTDEVTVGQTAADYFLKLGFQRFAYRGFDDMIWSGQRGENFSKTS